jgi:DUF4097 and DUF4098 domain-containing protein YvlB
MTLTTFLSLLGLISLPTASARTVDDTLPLAADGAVEIENICGAVTVVAWDRPEIRVTGTLVEADDLLELKGTGQRVTVAVIDSHGEDVDCGDLKVQLPPGVRLEIETVSADVAAAGITGTLEIETVSGDVQAQGAPAELEIETVSGEVSVSVATFSLDIETVSGDVEIHDASGRLEAETVSGEVDISGGPFSQVEVTTVSGDLDLRAGLAPSAKVQLDTHSGDVTLTLPPLDNVAWALSTFSGRIEGILAERKVSGFGPGTTMAYLQGDGSTGITVSTHSGDINIARK